LELGDLRGELGVEALRDEDVLVEARHRVPEVLLLEVERGVVLAELVLAVVERLDDRVELLLRALVAAEVVLDLAAERDEAEELLADARLARVEVLDRAAQLQQRLAHLRAVGDAALA